MCSKRSRKKYKTYSIHITSHTLLFDVLIIKKHCMKLKKDHFVCFSFVFLLLLFTHSNHCAPGVGVCDVRQWAEQCLRCGCWGPKDQSLLCRGRCVPKEFQVCWRFNKNTIHCNYTSVHHAFKKKKKISHISFCCLDFAECPWRTAAPMWRALSTGFCRGRVSPIENVNCPTGWTVSCCSIWRKPSATWTKCVFVSHFIWYFSDLVLFVPHYYSQLKGESTKHWIPLNGMYFMSEWCISLNRPFPLYMLSCCVFSLGHMWTTRSWVSDPFPWSPRTSLPSSTRRWKAGGQ